MIVTSHAHRLGSWRGEARGRIGLPGLVALALVLIGCSGDDNDTEQTAAPPAVVTRSATTPIVVAAGAPLLVGISAPISGPDAPAGGEDRDAAVAALERWKDEHGEQLLGHDIEVIVEDDGCTDEEIAAQAAQRLAARDGLVGVVGPNCSAGTIAALPVYAEAGIVTISGSATRSDLTTAQPDTLFFRTAYRNDLEGSLIGLYASFDLGAESGYLVDDGEAYGEDLATSAERIMARNGVNVSRESITRGTVEFGELAARIVEDDPTFVGFMGFNPEAALFYRQLRDAGYRGVFGASDAAATPEFVSAIGAAAEGVLFAGCQLTMAEDFVADFEQLSGYRPSSSAFAAQNADAMTVLLDGVAAVAERRGDGSLVVEPAALRDSIRATGLAKGVSGSFSFDDNGDRVPRGEASLPDVVDTALASQDLDAFVDLGLVPCQVQDGELVNLVGPGAQPPR